MPAEPGSAAVSFSVSPSETVAAVWLSVTFVGAFATVIFTFSGSQSPSVMVMVAEPTFTPLTCVPFTATYFLLLVASLTLTSERSAPVRSMATGFRSYTSPRPIVRRTPAGSLISEIAGVTRTHAAAVSSPTVA